MANGIKFARFTPEADADGVQEYPAQVQAVTVLGDLAINASGTYALASTLPGFTGYVTETGATWTP